MRIYETRKADRQQMVKDHIYCVKELSMYPEGHGETLKDFN